VKESFVDSHLVIDAFCGVGGNAIQFALSGKRGGSFTARSHPTTTKATQPESFTENQPVGPPSSLVVRGKGKNNKKLWDVPFKRVCCPVRMIKKNNT
jgi:hypothetical protein